MTIKVTRMLGGAYVATGVIDGLGWIGFGDSHDSAVTDMMAKAHNYKLSLNR